MSDPFFKIQKFSVSPRGIPLVTAHAKYWRSIHSEVMTHRDFTRNGRSSRAVPVKTLLEEIRNDPFIPRHWGANQKGMQAGEDCNSMVEIPHEERKYGTFATTREKAWLHARDCAVDVAEGYMNDGAGRSDDYTNEKPKGWLHRDQHRNFRGWRQFRSMIPGETVWDTSVSDKELVG